MSDWRRALTVATWMTLVTANAQDLKDQQIRLLDGKPFYWSGDFGEPRLQLKARF